MEIKRRKALLAKKRQTLVKQLQELEDPGCIERMEKEQQDKEQMKKQVAAEKAKLWAEEKKRKMK